MATAGVIVVAGAGAGPASADPVMTPSWLVAVASDGGSTVSATAMGNHRFNHVVVVGRFSGTGTIGTKRLRGLGGKDGFVAAIAHDGRVRWAVPLGGSGDDDATAVATGAKGSIFVTGSFTKRMRVGDTTLTASGGLATFVVHLDAEGSLEWARVVPSAKGTNDGLAIAVNERGRVAVAGHFQGVVKVPTADGVRKVTSFGWKGDGYTLRMSRTGRFEWIRSVGVESDQTLGTGVAMDADGDVFASYRSWDSEFGDSIAIMAKYSGRGKVYWTTKPDYGYEYLGLALDPDGNAVAVGTIYDWEVTVGDVTITPENVPALVLVTHASHGGAVLRVTSSTGAGTMSGAGIAVSATGVTTVSGLVDGTVSLGPVTLTTAEGTGALARWGADGSPMWAVATGPQDYDGPQVTSRSPGEVVTSGSGTGGELVGGTPLPGSGAVGYVVQWGAVTP